MSPSLLEASSSFIGLVVSLPVQIIRIVSILSLVIGICSILPLVLLVVLDIVLYTWRIYWSRFPSKSHTSTAPGTVATTTSNSSSHSSVAGHVGAASTTALVEAVGQSYSRPR